MRESPIGLCSVTSWGGMANPNQTCHQCPAGALIFVRNSPVSSATQ